MSPRAPHRFYFPGRLSLTETETVELSTEESRHLLRVLRLRAGAQVDVFDAGGFVYRAEVLGEREGIARVRLLAQLEPEPSTRGAPLNLAIAVIKRRPMDWLIEKLSELGVDTIQPLLTQRAVGLSDIKPYGDPPERWARLALAAAKQCGRNRPLSLLPPVPLIQWLERTAPPAHNFYAHPAPGAKLIGQAIAECSSAARPIWVAIGPEGGWTPAEQEAFEKAGFRPVLLGSLTLRSETAAIAAAAVCGMRNHE